MADRVSVVQPAQTATVMWETGDETADELQAAMSTAQRVVRDTFAGLRKSIPLSRKVAAPPERVVAVVG